MSVGFNMKAVWSEQIARLENENQILAERLSKIKVGKDVRLSYSMTVDAPDDIERAIRYNQERIERLKASLKRD